MKFVPTVLVGVALLGAVFADQSEAGNGDEKFVGVRDLVEQRGETPEVVLQLKYNAGELDRIFLTQFRKEQRVWYPSVNARTNLCADLCHAGLGGDVCGPSCQQMLPVGLQSALSDGNQTSALYGQPRVAVCPALCDNHLGKPLCECVTDEEVSNIKEVQWSNVCTAFCADGYPLSGCPQCEVSSSEDHAVGEISSFRALSTADGWQTWCNLQCLQGHGGAACNCDRSPFQ